VIVNLMNNGIEAMQPVTDRQRELVIRTHQDKAHRVLVAVQDCGVGGGRLSAFDNVGPGATFEFVLPPYEQVGSSSSLAHADA
jgi:signal transduction histidine kinase